MPYATLKTLVRRSLSISLPNCRQGIDAPKGRQVLISVGEGVLVSSWGGGGFGKKVVKFSSDTPSKEYARARSKDR